MLAMGVVDNQTSYIIVPFLTLALYSDRQNRLGMPHHLFLATTLFLAFYGTILGFLNGNNANYIFKFTAPILVFALFLPHRSLATVFFVHRHQANFFILIFTTFVSLLTLLSLRDLSVNFLRGWTITVSPDSAVSVWQYFALPFIGTLIFEFLHFKRNLRGAIRAAIASITLIMLLSINATSAFRIAVVALFIMILFPKIRIGFLIRILQLAFVLVLIDYISVRFLSEIILTFLNKNISDDGDLIRLAQINYFFAALNLEGHGFGVAHDFVFDNLNRADMHNSFPYASELPVLNLIHGGGLPAALWFAFVALTLFKLMKNFILSRGYDQRVYSFFSLSCLLVLVGSISNPFLFSPVSMLLIAIGFNSIDSFERLRLR